MDRIRHKRNYDLHSWLGITVGLILYIVCFTGAFALFDNEIKTWENPAKRIPITDTSVPMTETYAQWVEETAGGDEVTFRRFDFPTTYHPYFRGGMTVQRPVLDSNGDVIISDDGTPRTQGKFIDAFWDPQTGDEIAYRGDGLSTWILDFHRDFMWPDGLGGRTVGRSLVGVVGIVLLLAILSGVIAHTKIREEAYTMRLKRSTRLKWQDAHKVVGLWGLPFSTMIAFTGAWLGVIVILSQLVAALAFKGDTEALIEAVLGEESKPTGVQAQMLTLEELYDMRHPDTGKQPYLVLMSNYGDEAAEFELLYESNARLTMFDELHISGVTGEPVHGHDENAAIRVATALSPLHYGTYGGIWLKFLYFVLGLSVAVITALGSMMWIERRKYGNEGNKSPRYYDSLGHINTGVIMGLPVATLAIFYLDKLYIGSESARLVTTGWTYFAVWALGFVYAFARRNDYATTREVTMLSGLLAIGIPMLNGAATNQWFFSYLNADHAVSAWVDVTMLLGGLLTVACGYFLPAERKAKQKAKHNTETDQDAAAVPAE